MVGEVTLVPHVDVPVCARNRSAGHAWTTECTNSLGVDLGNQREFSSVVINAREELKTET